MRGEAFLAAKMTSGGFSRFIRIAFLHGILSVMPARVAAHALPGAWQTETNSFPVADYAHRAASWNGWLYVSGGVNSLGTVYRSSVNADGTLAPWILSANSLVNPARWSGMAVWKGWIYIAGGGTTAASYKGVQYAQIQPGGDVGPWTASANDLPVLMSLHAMTASNGRLFISGGGNTGATTSVYSAAINPDGSVGAWTLVSDMPAPLLDHGMVFQNDRLYVVGGDAALIGGSQSQVYFAPIRPDGTLGAWSTSGNPLPGPRDKAGVTACNGTIYVAGGRVGGYPYHAEVYHAHISTSGEIGAWSLTDPPLPEARSDGAMDAVGGSLFFVAGSSQIGGTGPPIKTVYSLAGVDGSECLPFGGRPVGISSITWSWENISSSSSFKVISHAGANLSGDLPPGTIAWTETGLGTNAPYERRLVAFNGLAYSTSSAVSRYTLAETPSGLSVVAVSSYSIAVNWNPGSNPSGTSYEVQSTSAADYLTLAIGTGTVALSSALPPSTTYSFRVRAFNGDSLATGFSALVTTTTLPPLPGAAGTPAGTALGVSSISWNWTSASDATSYLVYRASDGALLVSTTANSYADAGLGVNVLYGIRVKAVNATGSGPLSGPASSYTLANPPTGTSVAAVMKSSANIVWSLNGNPAVTMASVERSTDGATFGEVYFASATSFTDMTLMSCSTYYFRVRNKNGASIPTSYDTIKSLFTLGDPPSPAGALVAEPLGGGRILVSWTASPSGGISSYRLYFDSGTGTIDYATPLAVVGSTVTAYTTGVLISSASYRFGLRAQDACGTEEKNDTLVAAAPAASVLPAVSAAIKIPQAGKRIAGNRVTVMAELVSGDLASLFQVLFQSKPSAGTVWSDIPAADALHPNPDTDSPYFIHWDVTGLSAGSYDLRAIAKDGQGVADATPSSISVVIDPVSPDINETSLSGGRVQKQQAVFNAAPERIESGDGASQQTTRIDLPVGALNSSTVTVTLVNRPDGVPAGGAGLAATGVTAQVTLSNGQSQLLGGRTATIGLTYPDADGDGVVDGTGVRVEQLRIYSYDGASGVWRNDVPASLDSRASRVSGQTAHFSLFALFAPLASDLGAVRVYPTPFRPNAGVPDQGVAFTPGNPNSGIIFDNLPPATTIRIFTASGRLVARLPSDDASGRLRWDGRTSGGEDAASGGYLAVISSPGHPTVTKKFLIIR